MGFKIQDTAINYKEFCSVIDTDGSLSVDLKELNEFFDNYVNFKEQRINDLKMAEGLVGTVNDN